MKNIVLIALVALFGSMSVTAQEVDSLTADFSNPQIDSLSSKLNKLQHDYDFLSCQTQQNYYTQKLEHLDNQIQIERLSMLINIFHSKFDMTLYTAYQTSYNSCIELFDTYKEAIDALNALISLKMSTTNFSEAEIEVLRKKDVYFAGLLLRLELSINLFKQTLDVYAKLK